MVRLKCNQRIFSWHQWCGLAVGLFLLFMSISGAILVFTDEWEESADARWVKVDNPSGTFSYDASLPRVRSQYPGWEIRAYGQPAANAALIYELRKGELRKRVFAHPQSGELLHVSGQARWYQQLLLFHYTLFSGTSGKITVFFIGVLFLISLITGLYVYRKSIVRVLLFRVRLNLKNKRSYNSSLHRIVGVWSLLFNLLIVTAGLTLAGQISLGALNGTKPAKAAASSTINSVDALRTSLLQANKDFEIHLLRIRPSGNTVQFSGHYTNDPFYYGKYYSYFILNGETGAVENKVVLREQPLSKRLLAHSGPLHFGNWGGVVVKILYCLFGLTPALLSITGFVIWMRSGKKKKPQQAVRQQRSVIA
jgi:uncharacterized iron-regulated membrane protein